MEVTAKKVAANSPQGLKETHAPETPPASVEQVLAAQKAFFKTGQTKDIAWRKEQLKKLKAAIEKHEAKLSEAMAADLGKGPFEAFTHEIGLTLIELKHAIQHIKSWARPKRKQLSMNSFPSSGKIYYEPYGRALVISPWNYPFMLAMAPVVGALAAGNTVILKPSEITVHTSAAMKALIAETFDEQYCTVLEGGVATNQALLQHKLDYIFYTGGTRVGQIIYEAAAKHLTPVTLELGGKSPCIIDKHAKLSLAARRTVWGKFLNTGQTCVAPDYVLVHEEVRDALVAKLKEEIARQLGEQPLEGPDYGKMVNQKHFERLASYLDNGTLVHGGKTKPETRQLEPSILIDVPADAPVLTEEIFGPVLPILTYKNLDEAIAFVNERPRPLALYIFSQKSNVSDRVIRETSAGGGCVNDVVLHLAESALPFGGVGYSGIGAYHGEHSFKTFSHERGVLHAGTWLDLPLRYPPYAGKLKWIKRLMS